MRTYQMVAHVVGAIVAGQPEDSGGVRVAGYETRLLQIPPQQFLHAQVQVVCKQPSILSPEYL
jgi:hypothetical protein